MEGNVTNYQAMLGAMQEVGSNLDVTIGNPLEEVRSASVEFIEIMEPELMKDQAKSLANGKDAFLQTIQDGKGTSELVEVNQEAMDYIIHHMEKEHTKGLFYCVDGEVIVGIDNLTSEARIEEFGHVVKCKAWVKGYDLDVQQPQIFIEWSEAPELQNNTMMGVFARPLEKVYFRIIQKYSP